MQDEQTETPPDDESADYGGHGEDAADKPDGGALSADNPTDPSEPDEDTEGGEDEPAPQEDAGGEAPDAQGEQPLDQQQPHGESGR